MAKLPSEFNADEHEDMNSYELIPDNTELTVKIVDSDYVENSKGNGHFLRLEREVVGGKYDGKKIWSNLNLDNPSKTAVEIANKEFATTCRACGVINVEDSEELHGIEHTVKVGIRKGQGDYPDQNTIKKIQALEGAAVPPKTGKKSTEETEDEMPAPKKRKRPVFED